jgi:hypothetical protein
MAAGSGLIHIQAQYVDLQFRFLNKYTTVLTGVMSLAIIDGLWDNCL